jgi:hypothetical protein
MSRRGRDDSGGEHQSGKAKHDVHDGLSDIQNPTN